MIRPGARVLDLGAAPGSWTQVAAKRGAASVLALDLLPIDPIHGATIIQGDFADPEMPARLTAELGGHADLVLSDMAPNTTGHGATDHIRIVALAEMALDLAVRILTPGGGFVAKVLQGGSEREVLSALKRHFSHVRHAKPPASRKQSSELYVVALGFKGAGGSKALGGSKARTERDQSPRQIVSKTLHVSVIQHNLISIFAKSPYSCPSCPC